MSVDPAFKFRLRGRDLIVFGIFVSIVMVPLFYPLFNFKSAPPVVSDAELRSQQRQDFQEAHEGQPFRFFSTPVLRQDVSVFASGPQDTIRMEMGGLICSVVDIDETNGYIIYIPERNGLADYHYVNLRICNQLTLMGNPNIELIEEKLTKISALPPLSELGVPITDSQSDGPFHFSDLNLSNDGEAWVLEGTVTSELDIKPRFTWFDYEILAANRRIAAGQIQVEDLTSEQPHVFSVIVDDVFKRAGVAPEDCRIKLVLRMTSDRVFGRRDGVPSQSKSSK